MRPVHPAIAASAGRHSRVGLLSRAIVNKIAMIGRWAIASVFPNSKTAPTNMIASTMALKRRARGVQTSANAAPLVYAPPMPPHDDPAYLRERAVQFRRIAARSDTTVAAKLHAVAIELE